MASLYKKPIHVRDPKTGEKIKANSRKWWGRYRDENGLEKRVPLAADKTAAQAMLNGIVRKVERRSAGLEDPFENHLKRPLAEHVADYKKHLANKGTTSAHMNTTIQRVRAIIDICKFEQINQISGSRVQEALADLRRQGKSIASSNHYLTAIKMFTRWLMRDRRTNEDRLLQLGKMNADLDRRRIRRPLSMEEFGQLLEAAEAGPEIQGISGADRAIIYIVGAYTGYRRNEIGSVTRTSFDFENEPATLTVKAGYSKHRRTDVLPLRRDFAERIRNWIAAKSDLEPGEPLFRIAGKRTAEMIQTDLEAARNRWLKAAEAEPTEYRRRAQSDFLAYENKQGHVVDFHSLRFTFITNLTRSGVTPKTAQLLARHSDINLTMNTYTKLGVVDQAAAVETLPPIPTGSSASEAGRLRATGTDGRLARNARFTKADASPQGAGEVPTVVPRGAEIGAILPASNTLQIASVCTEHGAEQPTNRKPENAKSPEELGAFRGSLPCPASI